MVAVFHSAAISSAQERLYGDTTGVPAVQALDRWQVGPSSGSFSAAYCLLGLPLALCVFLPLLVSVSYAQASSLTGQ